MPRSTAKVIGFFGYKGGLGRTICATSVATIFAEQGRRVLLIDGDAEAPGLSLSAAYADQLLGKPGLVQLLLGDLSAEDAISAAAPVSPGGFTRRPAHNGSLRLLGAGTVRSATGGPGLNTRALGEALDSLAASVSLEGPLEQVERRWSDLVDRLKASDEFDVVILDMRTGFSQLTGMMMRSCDVVVFMCGLNQQNILGTASILRDLGDAAPRSVLLASSPVPSSATSGLDDSWRMFNEVFGPIRPHGQPLMVNGRPRLSLPYSPILAVTDDPAKYVREPDLMAAFADFTNALREALGLGVKDLLAELRAAMVSEDTADVDKLKRLLVELARINGVRGMLAREGQAWHHSSVPSTLALALDAAVEELKALGDEVGDDVTLEVAKHWVYKLRFSRPSQDSARVLELYRHLVHRLDAGSWIPQDPRGQPGRVVGRLRVDYADAILNHQRYRVVQLGEPVDVDALAIAERELRQLRVDLVGPGTLIWCARVITHLVRLLPAAELLSSEADGATRIQALAALAEAHLKRAEGAAGHKTWSEYVQVGLAIAWPPEDKDEKRRRIVHALQCTYNDATYRDYGPLAASYDRAILQLRLGEVDKAKEELQVLRYDAKLLAIALKDPDLLELREYIQARYTNTRM
ncbi:AAA family ATPase [Myxococcota bacterium]|nr:AAA family ATPase [Myxococcota bacterium]